ncbi:MAG: sulfite exporter TauE/SafE family protein [Rhodopirellula sp.]|nr:sulfite exporter TauE/SafE family protein [Rhodopirellula sp.]
MDALDVTLVCGIIFVGSLVRSTLGFGEALIAMPLLAFVIPAQVAAPLVAVVSSFNAILILYREWRKISFRETGTLTVAALMGIPVGIWLLSSSSEATIKVLLAIVVIGFAVWSLSNRRAIRILPARWAPVFGLVAGILGGAYNTAGPPLVIFGTLRQWPAERFRANLQSYFLLGGTTVLAMHISRGAVNSDVLRLTAMCLPLTIVASLCGQRLTRSVSTEQFIRVAHVCLLLIGTLLLVTVAVDAA